MTPANPLNPAGPETPEADTANAPMINTSARQLSQRRLELVLLEGRCGDSDHTEPGWAPWLYPAAVVLLSTGCALTIPQGEALWRLVAGLAFGLWAANAFERTLRTARQASAEEGRGNRRLLAEVGLWSAQALGAITLVTLFAPSAPAMGLLASGALAAAVKGWLAGHCDPRTERLRVDLDEAREGLNHAEAAFELELEQARAAFDDQVARARKVAGMAEAPSIAAE